MNSNADVPTLLYSAYFYAIGLFLKFTIAQLDMPTVIQSLMQSELLESESFTNSMDGSTNGINKA